MYMRILGKQDEDTNVLKKLNAVTNDTIILLCKIIKTQLCRTTILKARESNSELQN